jgi:hypothetical protein
MVTHLNDRMVNTRNGQGDVEAPRVNGLNPPPPRALAQAIASILESRDKQTMLLRQLVANSARGGNRARNAPALAPTTYREFAATHPPIFTEAGEPLLADHWLCTIESKFGLLHCTELQKTLHRTTAVWRRQRVVGQLHHRLSSGLPDAMGRVPQCFPCPSHPIRNDEKELPRIHGPEARWRVYT